MWPTVIIEKLSKGAERCLDLVLAPYDREKKYKDVLREAQAQKDAKAIESGEKVFDGRVLQQSLAMPDLPQGLPLEFLPLAEGLRQEACNYNNTVGSALTLLSDVPDSDVSDEPVSPDWFSRWRREAQIISDKGLQQIWGRILAEEVKSPQSISLKTLDILRNVTANDAEMFCNIAKYRIDRIIPLALYDKIFSRDMSPIIQMQHLDLISAGDSFATPPRDISEVIGKAYECSGFLLYFQPARELNQLEYIKGFSISAAGMEILKFSDTAPTLSQEEICELGDIVWNSVKNICPEMTAHPRMANDSFDNTVIIQKWGK